MTRLTIVASTGGRRPWFVADEDCGPGTEECLCAWFDTRAEAEFYIASQEQS